MEDTAWLWVIIGIVGFSLYESKSETKEARMLSLSRAQYEEINLVNAKTKIDELLNKANQDYSQSYNESASGKLNLNNEINTIKQDVDNALVDIRGELTDLHKKLDD